jgi:hypothetical protein
VLQSKSLVPLLLMFAMEPANDLDRTSLGAVGVCHAWSTQAFTIACFKSAITSATPDIH